MKTREKDENLLNLEGLPTTSINSTFLLRKKIVIKVTCVLYTWVKLIRGSLMHAFF